MRGGKQAAPKEAPQHAEELEEVVTLEERRNDFTIIKDVRDPRAQRPANLYPWLASLGAGESLEPRLKSKLESSFGERLDFVRVHRDSAEATSMGTRGFALGSHIAFARGAYAPNTLAGDVLAAHEAAHALQHRAGRAGRIASPSVLESQAEQAGVDAASGRRASIDGASGGLSIQRCSNPPTTSMASVKFKSSHTMFGPSGCGTSPPTPDWTPGAKNHVVAYTMGTNPQVDATATVVRSGTPPPTLPNVDVEAREGLSARGNITGVNPNTSPVNIFGLTLSGLSGSGAVGLSSSTLDWYYRVPASTWTAIGPSGPHPIHWLLGTPRALPVDQRLVERVTRHGAGITNDTALATALRHSIRGADHVYYSPGASTPANPVDLYTDGTGDCAAFANLLVALARAAGMDANTVMIWGGFTSAGRAVWVMVPGVGSISDVRGPVPAYNFPTGGGWDFAYHAVAMINGQYHDAALDSDVFSGYAAYSGGVEFLEVDASAPLPDAHVGRSYGETIRRRRHSVTVNRQPMGNEIHNTDLARSITIVSPGAGGNVPVDWSVAPGGSLPAGLTLDAATGRISGTPTAAGTFTFNVRLSYIEPTGHAEDSAAESRITLRVVP